MLKVFENYIEKTKNFEVKDQNYWKYYIKLANLSNNIKIKRRVAQIFLDTSNSDIWISNTKEIINFLKNVGKEVYSEFFKSCFVYENVSLNLSIEDIDFSMLGKKVAKATIKKIELMKERTTDLDLIEILENIVYKYGSNTIDFLEKYVNNNSNNNSDNIELNIGYAKLLLFLCNDNPDYVDSVIITSQYELNRISQILKIYAPIWIDYSNKNSVLKFDINGKEYIYDKRTAAFSQVITDYPSLLENPDIPYQEYNRINNIFISKCGTEYINVLSDILYQNEKMIDYNKLRQTNVNNTIIDYSLVDDNIDIICIKEEDNLIFELLKYDKITLEQIIEIPTYTQLRKIKQKTYLDRAHYEQVMFDLLHCGIFTIEFDSFPSNENLSLIKNLELDMFLFKYIAENI